MVTMKKAVKKPGASRVASKKSAAVKSIALDLPRIGAPWAGQGGNLIGIIRGEKGQPDYCLVVPTNKSAKLKGIYGPLERVTGAESEYDGLANTKAMAAAGSDVAKRVLALQISGHADFYIPSRREARLAQTNAPELFSPEAHWTSTQYRARSDYAWVQTFGRGNQYAGHKSNVFPVRAVRRVPIQ
jgi:hypothetical protein